MKSPCGKCTKAKDEAYSRRPLNRVEVSLFILLFLSLLAILLMAAHQAISPPVPHEPSPQSWLVLMDVMVVVMTVFLAICIRQLYRRAIANPEHCHFLDAEGQPHEHQSLPEAVQVRQADGTYKYLYRDDDRRPVKHQAVVVQPIRAGSEWRARLLRSGMSTLPMKTFYIEGAGRRTTITIGGREITCVPTLAIELLAIPFSNQDLPEQIRADKAEVADARQLAVDLFALGGYFEAVPVNSQWAQGGKERLNVIWLEHSRTCPTLWEEAYRLTPELIADRLDRLEDHIFIGESTKGAYRKILPREIARFAERNRPSTADVEYI